MEKRIERYINKNDILRISLTRYNGSANIANHVLYLDYFIGNYEISQKIINSGKFLSIKFDYQFEYENINILLYAKQIIININNISKKNIITIIKKPINLQKLEISYANIADIDIINELYEKPNIKYVKIMCETSIDLYYIYTIMKIKSLNSLCLTDDPCDRISLEKIFEILYYIINNLNKDIKIVIKTCCMLYLMTKRYLKLISYNFKVNENNYIFTYIPTIFTKFDNSYDFNLCYL